MTVVGGTATACFKADFRSEKAEWLHSVSHLFIYRARCFLTTVGKEWSGVVTEVIIRKEKLCASERNRFCVTTTRGEGNSLRVSGSMDNIAQDI